MKINRKALLMLMTLIPFQYGFAKSTNEINEWSKIDERLNLEINYESKRAYIGEILKDISDKTKINFILTGKDGAMGVPVFVCFRQMKVTDFMEAILSLNSIRGGYWKWQKNEKDKKVFYQLVRTPAAVQFPQIMGDQIEEDFRKDLEICMKAADMSDEDREKFLQNQPIANKYNFKGDITSVMKSFSALSKGTRDKIIFSGDRITLPLSSLPSDQQHYIDDYFTSKTTMTLNGQKVRTPETISFSVDRMINGLPRLKMNWGMFGRTGAGGKPFMDKWLNDIMDRWIMSGDSKNDPEEKLNEGNIFPQDGSSKNIIDSMFYWGKSNNINIIGHCALNTYGNSAVTGKVSKENVLNQFMCIRKWRGKVLLISYVPWFIKESNASIVDYDLLEYIKKQNVMTIPVMIYISKRLTDDAAKELMFRFPALSQAVRSQREELQFLAENKTLTQRLLQPQGTPLNSAIRGLFDAFHVFQVPSGTQAVRLGLGKQAFAVIEFLGGRGQVLETWPH